MTSAVELLPGFARLRQLYDEIYAHRGPNAKSTADIIRVLNVAGPPGSDLAKLREACDAELSTRDLFRWRIWRQEVMAPVPLYPGADTSVLSLRTIWPAADNKDMMLDLKPDVRIMHAVMPPAVHWDSLISVTEEKVTEWWDRKEILSQLESYLLKRVTLILDARYAIGRLDTSFLRPYFVMLAIDTFLVCAKWETISE